MSREDEAALRAAIEEQVATFLEGTESIYSESEDENKALVESDGLEFDDSQKEAKSSDRQANDYTDKDNAEGEQHIAGWAAAYWSGNGDCYNNEQQDQEATEEYETLARESSAPSTPRLNKVSSPQEGSEPQPQYPAHWPPVPPPGSIEAEHYHMAMRHMAFLHWQFGQPHHYLYPLPGYLLSYAHHENWRHHAGQRHNSKTVKAGSKVPDHKRVAQELKLLPELAEFEMMSDVAVSGKLEGYGLSCWRVIQHYRIPDSLQEKQNELFRNLLRREARVHYVSRQLRQLYNLVNYAMYEGSHEVAQKAFELAEVQLKSRMVKIIDGSMKLLMKDKPGCLFLQQVLHTTCNLSEGAEGQDEFLRTVVGTFQKFLLQKGAIVQCSNHPHGNYVVQVWVKLLQHLPDCFIVQGLQPRVKFQEEVHSNIIRIGVEKIGCRIILRLLEHKKTSADLLQKLLEISTLESLMTSDGGNYVVQGILENGCAADKVQLLVHMYNNFNLHSGPGKVHYANHSLARHVLQKSFQVYPELEVCEAQARILRLVLEPNGQVNPDYLHLDLDPYVVKAMQDCQREQGALRKASAEMHSLGK